MRKALLPAIFCLLSFCARAQSTGESDTTEFSQGSKIVLKNLSPSQVANISLLAKVWGFLKYYHPSVAAGKYNWDYELFRFLPAYLKATNTADRDRLLLGWINSYGAVPTCKKCDTSLKAVALKPDLNWINVGLSDSLTARLNYIKQNRHQGPQFYVNIDFNEFKPDIVHENPYARSLYPDDGYRLLALFRYWNIIQYWFPYRDLIGEDWKDVLTEFIPKFIGDQNEMEYWRTAQQLIGRVHDSHANLVNSNPAWQQRFGKYYPPVKVTFISNDPVVSLVIKDTLANLSEIKRGDVIREIDGKKVADIIRERLPNLPGSNHSVQLRDLSLQLLISTDSISAVTVERDGKQLKIKLHHYIPATGSWYHFDFPYQKDSSFFFIQPDIGYINLRTIRQRQVDSVFRALQGSKGLIIDNRQYPSDFPVYFIASNLYPNKKPFAKFSSANENYPGAFNLLNEVSAGRKNENYYKGKVIILVNEFSQSSSEFHSMAFRISPGAMVIGSTTAGADGNVNDYFFLPGGISTCFSGLGVFYPDGRQTQRIGIIPDVEVKRTVAGIKDGRDELVEEAIGIIRK
jgi:hypothetical protein